MTHNITKCRSCGADIIFITTENGRKMPCDAAAVDYQDNIKGKDVIVTDAGKVLKASIVRPTQTQYQSTRGNFTRPVQTQTQPLKA